MTQSSSGPVFMSYSRRDEVVTRRIVEFLRAQGINVWVDNEKLIPGTPIWEEEIEKAIKSTGAVVVVMSPDSKNSEWVRREISLADQYRKRIFPVLVRGDEDTSITLRLITRQFVDIRTNEKVHLKSLSTALSIYLEELSSPEQILGEDTEKLAVSRRRAPAGAESEVIRDTSEAKPLSSESPELQQRPIPDKATLTSSWTSVFWITLGWVIGGAIGGAIYWAWGDYSEVFGGAIGGALGGFVTGIILRDARLLSNWKSVLGITLGWAIGGAPGWIIGDVLTEATGAAIGGAIAAAIGVTITSRIEHVLSHWKSILWIILSWAFSWSVGWIISRYFQVELGEGAIGWPIGEAIGWGIGGFVMGWQIMRR